MRFTSHTRGHRRRQAGAAGVALAALAAGTGTAYAASSHNEQVVLHNGTDAQADAKSAVNGTAQVSSYDGRFVVFSTTAALVGRDRNEVDDVYLRDTVDGITILVSSRGRTTGNDASFEPTISDDGRYVAFTTAATNLFDDRNGGTLDVAVKDLFTGKVRVASVDSHGKQRARNSFFPVLAGNAKRVAFQTFGAFGPRDGDRREDVYLHSLGRGWTRQMSLSTAGRDVARSVLVGDVSDDGTRVTFGDANDLWVRDTAAGRTTRFWHEPDSPPCQPFPAGSAGRPAISGNGRYVAFATCATKIPGSDGQAAQVYRMSLATGDIVLVSTPGAGVPAAGNSFLPSLSRSGRYVGFGSEATDLAPADTADPDAFVADLGTGAVTRASQSADGTGGNSWSASTGVAISGDGQSLVYESYATNLVADDAYDWEEVVVWRR
jgi:Tol biopolymer transport system component